MAMPDWASFVMPVTTSTAVAVRVVAPALEPPAGADMLTWSVRPAGIAVLMLAVILAPLWLVVTAHEAAAEACVGLLPAVAVLINSEGEPATAIWLMASTWKLTLCVAVWADSEAAPATRATTAKRMDFIGTGL